MDYEKAAFISTAFAFQMHSITMATTAYPVRIAGVFLPTGIKAFVSLIIVAYVLYLIAFLIQQLRIYPDVMVRKNVINVILFVMLIFAGN